jgi:hypothetical protein
VRLTADSPEHCGRVAAKPPGIHRRTPCGYELAQEKYSATTGSYTSNSNCSTRGEKHLNTNFSNITIYKRVHTSLHTTFRHAVALVAFALFSSFSGAAVSSSVHNSVHKCLQANGQYEFTDKKCVATTPAAVPAKSGSENNSTNSEAKRTDPPHANAIAQPHEASTAHAPLEAQPKHDSLPSGSTVPSAPQKNSNPTT